MSEDWALIIETARKLFYVSNLGRIKSIHKTTGSTVFIKPRLNTNGYARVYLPTHYKSNKQKDFYIHRLVALHFIPKEDNKTEVNHLNFN